MHRNAFLTVGFFIVAGLFPACKRIDPCIKKSENNYTVKLGDTIEIRSCSYYAEMYRWTVEGEELNFYVNPPQPFYEHYADSGGGSCDDFVRLIFFDTGSFRVDLDVAMLRNGKCDEVLEMPEGGRAHVEVHVLDTNKS